MAETDREQVISMLRCCLLSTKGSIPASNLERDYKMLVGSRIPYQKLGYQNLEQFLKSVPGLSVSQGRNGELILDAIPTEKSEHLVEMIARQKSAPRKPTSNFLPRRTAASSWRPPPSAVSVKPSRKATSPRRPLSVTFSNQGKKPQSFERPSRRVSFSPNVTASSSVTQASTHNKSSYQAFEKPPRFLKMKPQENSASTSASVAAAPTSASASFKTPAVPNPVQASSSTEGKSRVQDRLQNAVKNKNVTLNLNDLTLSKSSDVPNSGGRTITSPLTPLQARLSAAVRKPPQVNVVNPQSTIQEVLASGEDYIKRLEDFAISKGMSVPVFKVMPRMSDGKAFYSCSVKIDELRYSSYPDERSSPRDAMLVAAKQAYDELSKLNSAVGGSATQDENMIMTRISNIVGEHRCGIWAMQIPIDYNTKYKEALPDDWIKIMHRCPFVCMEHAAGNRIILTPNWPLSSSTLNQVVAPVVNTMDVPHSKPLLSPIGPAVPEQITLPEEDAWDLYITCGYSTDEIWARIIGDEYSVKYENLATDMEMFYMGQGSVATNPEVGLFYAIKMDDCWHRVELMEINEAGTEAGVFFIDHGDEERVDMKELHVLEKRFARLPAQAIFCYLWGLEEFADDLHAPEHITATIVGKSLVASVKSRPNPDNPAAGVVLFDTSTEEDVNMNNVLVDCITSNAKPPRLPLEGKAEETYISHVTDKGDIFLQFDSYSYLQTLVANVIETGFKEHHLLKGTDDCSPNPNRVYLARYHLDGNWYRAIITKKLQGCKEVEVMFIDFGNTEIIDPSDLIILEAVKKLVANFPAQAIKVNLNNVSSTSFNERMAQRVRELVPFDERVIVKTVSLPRMTNSVPVVEIFKRIQPDNLLVSISDTLNYDPEMRPSVDDNSNVRGKKRLERLQSLTSSGDSSVISNMLHSPTGSDSPNDTSPRGLSPPQIPDIGEYFDVHVTMAANPGNFTVQPYKDATRLEKMMEELQVHYKRQKYPCPTPESVREGGLYAAFHNDSHWYRVCVSNVINGNMVSVYFCDYGDVSVLTVDKLQPLTNQFKELPYQAIKAKLAGIQPIHSDWSVEDCLMFQEMVVEHQFVSVIMETGPDLLNPSDTVIGLKLIDTSGEEDVYIDQLLVNQERAILTPVL